jgi:hypothetical protein
MINGICAGPGDPADKEKAKSDDALEACTKALIDPKAYIIQNARVQEHERVRTFAVSRQRLLRPICLQECIHSLAQSKGGSFNTRPRRLRSIGLQHSLPTAAPYKMK